jgi:hypothetical protein
MTIITVVPDIKSPALRKGVDQMKSHLVPFKYKEIIKIISEILNKPLPTVVWPIFGKVSGFLNDFDKDCAFI